MSQDTLCLLKECASGIQMGISTIENVEENVEDESMALLLKDSKEEHERLFEEAKNLLDHMDAETPEPNLFTKGMARVKSEFVLVMDDDKKIADLIVDGCNMGVKSVHKYMNQYPNADEQTKKMARRLVNIEERLSVDLRNYL